MFERNIYQVYGLFCEERFLLRDMEAFHANGEIYIFVPKDDYPLQDRINLANVLKQNGEERVCELVLTVRNEQTAIIDGFEGALFVAPKQKYNAYRSNGEQLATLHERGEMKSEVDMRSLRMNFFNRWDMIWARRLEQLENWYHRLLHQGAETEIDELFLMTFPYYLGLTETAIQYYLNSKRDHVLSKIENPTICHAHFTEKSWLVLPDRVSQVILPTDLLLDHSSRDIAEYIRYLILMKKASYDEVSEFITNYSYVKPISDYSWQLIYARLLFPIHYFTAVESYYKNQLIERHLPLAERFMETIYLEEENEQFLKMVQQLIRNEAVEWLME